MSVRIRTIVIPGLFLFLGATIPTVLAQTSAQQIIPSDEIRRLVQAFKQDPRGPYQAIRWFCPDGSIIVPQARCGEPGGIQHALDKDVVVRLQRQNGVFLGQILSGTPNDAFLDEANHYARLKQYQLEKYLQAVDDGWILRRARYYRGAIQAEDEEAWGRTFLSWALDQDDLLNAQYFMLREAARDLPHTSANNAVMQSRALSKTVADAYPAFMDIRVKIHGQPDITDIDLVTTFKEVHRSRLPERVRNNLDMLERDMRRFYQVPETERLNRLLSNLPATTPIRREVHSFVAGVEKLSSSEQVRAISELLWKLRLAVPDARGGKNRLTLLDASLSLESILFGAIGLWQPLTVGELLEKNYVLCRAAAGTGLIENWEWESVESSLRPPDTEARLTLDQFREYVEIAGRVVEWGIGTTLAHYSSVVNKFGAFEPLAGGFTDDRMRSSVLLALGTSASKASELLSELTDVSNEVMGIPDVDRLRGLNAGIAVGQLQVITDNVDDVDFLPDRIYVLLRTPGELKPVAGIATVSEGNVVSHVQLLARNLGIPNAVLSPELLTELAVHSGKTVFFAVSPRGVVRLKPASDMTDQERVLVEERRRSEERIRVPTDRIDLRSFNLTSLYALRSSDSGRISGPKAANLGQLSSLFPGKVAPGFILPFAVFRTHMEQSMPGTSSTYWQYLRDTFEAAERARNAGTTEAAIDEEILRRLAVLREGIEAMSLKPDFIRALRLRFSEEFGAELGSVPVFVRSDTNMEDLKDFTGAGLNLTVPNVVKEEEILQAIRRVWASPYRERGYRWRQKFLLNPEDVYPSLLILKSVDVEKSGVLITTGIASAETRDVTIAFNRGVGGAVDGQAAETYLLQHNGNDILMTPAREPTYRTLPARGGTRTSFTSFEKPILIASERNELRAIAGEIRQRLPGTPGIESNGPFDVELGLLNSAIVLFQVRPFVENSQAAATTYLQAMDAVTPRQSSVFMKQRLADPASRGR